MKASPFYGPSNTALKVELGAGESCISESGALLAMNGNIGITTTTYKKGGGSFLKGLKRLFAGESFFLNHFEAKSGEGEVWLSSALPGDITCEELKSAKIIVQSGSFLCASSSLEMDVGWQGFKNVFSGESLFWLEVKGDGLIAMTAFGAIYEVEVNGDYVVDTGHIVAFEETLNFSLSKAGSSWLHSMMGGEGIICHFKGKGKLWCQSHNPRGFGQSLSPDLRPRQA